MITAAVNPVGTHTGPWTFEQALTCMKAGGKVRRKAYPATWYQLIEGSVFVDDYGDPALFDSEDLLANDWEPVGG